MKVTGVAREWGESEEADSPLTVDKNGSKAFFSNGMDQQEAEATNPKSVLVAVPKRLEF